MTERRERSFTDEDLAALAKAISAHQELHCRYKISPERMEAAVIFFENFNSIAEDSKKTIRRALLVIAVTAICGMIWLGFGSRILMLLKGQPQ